MPHDSNSRPNKARDAARAADGLLEALNGFNERLAPLAKYDLMADPLSEQAWRDLWRAAGRLSYALERYDGRQRGGSIEPRTADPRTIPAAER